MLLKTETLLHSILHWAALLLNLALLYWHILFCYFDNCTFITTLSSVTVIVQSTCMYVRVYRLYAHFTHYVHNTVPTSQMRGGQWAPSVCLLSEISRCVWTDLDESFSSRTTPWPSGECGKVHTHKKRAGGVDRFFQLYMCIWPGYSEVCKGFVAQCLEGYMCI